jgi:hypothetical protein
MRTSVLSCPDRFEKGGLGSRVKILKIGNYCGKAALNKKNATKMMYALAYVIFLL